MADGFLLQNNLQELDRLIAKWRGVGQEVAEELVQRLSHKPEPPTIATLLDHLHIDHSLLHYNAEDEEFY